VAPGAFEKEYFLILRKIVLVSCLFTLELYMILHFGATPAIPLRHLNNGRNEGMETVSVKDLNEIANDVREITREIEPVKVNCLDCLVALTIMFTLVTYLMNFYI
jgi:hypothetical protein